jgi:hypothetical protein
MGCFNILGLSESKLKTVLKAYREGKISFTISGQKYWIENLHSLQIFTHDHKIEPQNIYNIAEELGIVHSSFFGDNYLSPEGLEKFGKNVTDEIFGDMEFGQEVSVQAVQQKVIRFVHPDRLESLRNLKVESFDLSRLVKLCEELNDNFQRENFLSVAMIGRSILDHVPPIFGLKTFNEVANNYGGKSFKKASQHLNSTMRSIADSYLHETIRSKESLPNENQVNFSQDLDVLIGEIIRIS